jgi:haloalkane dehalogenase
MASVRIVSTQSRSMSEASRAPELIDCLSASSAIGGGPIIYIFARVPDAIRTPDELFEDLPDYPFAPQHRDFDGLRLAHLDEGDGEPVVFFHGEPTWSFLWRKVIPPVRDAGYRCIAPDLPGFGRSDKPTAIEWYTYDRHAESAAALLEELDVRDATAVVHDWGGPIGLRAAVEYPERIGRLVMLDTGLFTGHQQMNEAWLTFRDFVKRVEDLPVGLLVRNACKRDPGDEVIAAYEAPFPNSASKAGARAFPLILPTTPQMPGAAVGQRVLEALRSDSRPKLVLWADSDPVLPLQTGRRFAEAIGTEVHHVVEDASHFLQEDAGATLGGVIADWLRSG